MTVMENWGEGNAVPLGEDQAGSDDPAILT